MVKNIGISAIITGVLVSIAGISGLILTSSTSSADVVDDVSITVPVACGINDTLDAPHTATINPGTIVEDIGTTTFKVFCNDNTGYALYAIGYSNEEYGNTNLLPTNTSNPAIATGLATSGNTSNWAMKLTPVTEQSSGTVQPYVPTIESDTNGSFANYHIVPEEYTKVATFTSTTDFTIGSSLTSTYRAFVQGLQPADTYNGKVKYTLVHPNDANPPEKPKKVAYLDTGPTVNSKLLIMGGHLDRANSLPSDFIPSDENTISTIDSPTPVYLFYDGNGDYCSQQSCLYTEAERIYLNSDSSSMFKNDEGVNVSDAFMDGFDVSNVTNMADMFHCASVPASAIAKWDVSNVTNMSGMFYNAEECPDSGLIDVDSTTFAEWDVSNVIDMSRMFYSNSYARKIMTDEVIKGLSRWDISNVKNMGYMFYCAYLLTNIDALSNWDTSSVTDMNSMFHDASSLTDIDALSNWDTSSVTNMSYMFKYTSSLTDISGAANWNTSNVTTIQGMFNGVNNIDATVLNNWNVSKVTNKTNAFTCPADKRPSWY